MIVRALLRSVNAAVPRDGNFHLFVELEASTDDEGKLRNTLTSSNKSREVFIVSEDELSGLDKRDFIDGLQRYVDQYWREKGIS